MIVLYFKTRDLTEDSVIHMSQCTCIYICHDTHMHFGEGYFELNIGHSESESYDNILEKEV